MLDHTSIDLYGIPSEGASLLFEETLRDAPEDDLYYVSIKFKGAWQLRTSEV